MKALIFIPIFFFAVIGTYAQERKLLPFPSDSLKSFPPLEHRKIDTLRYYKPGDTIPNQLWENYLKSKKDNKNKSFAAPVDNMPIIVPPEHSFSLIIVKPDSTVHYHIRNFGTEKKVSPANK